MRTVASRLAEACNAVRQGQADRRDLLAAGLGSTLIADCVRDGLLLRYHRGAYGLAPLPTRGRHLLSDGRVDVGYLAEARSVLHSMRPDVVADRRTSAVMWQMDMLVEPKLVEVRAPRSQTRTPLVGVDLRSSEATAATEVAVGGLEAIRCTPALDTVLDCCLVRPMREAVVIADSALRRQLVTVDELVAGVAARAGTPGVKRLRRLLTLIDPQSGSVLESLLRFLLNTNALWPSSQVVMKSRDGKRTLGRVDFAFETARLIVECDGRRWHDPDDARHNDRRRDNSMVRVGWRVLRFSWDEVRNSPAYVLACVREALQPAAA
jgi:hypothetical protein